MERCSLSPGTARSGTGWYHLPMGYNLMKMYVFNNILYILVAGCKDDELEIYKKKSDKGISKFEIRNTRFEIRN